MLTHAARSTDQKAGQSTRLPHVPFMDFGGDAMRNDFYVYTHKRATDGRVFYVGKGTKNRAYSKHGRNRYWQRVASKHGFEVDVVHQSLSETDALKKEIALIERFKSSGVRLANITAGGDGVRSDTYPDELRERMRKVTSARRPEVRAKISQARLGSVVSDETKAKISAASKKRWSENKDKMNEAARLRASHPDFSAKVSAGVIKAMTADVRAKMSLSHIGKKNTDEAKRKISEKAIIRYSKPEYKEKRISAHWVKQVECSNGLVFGSLRAAETWLRQNGFPTARQSNISSCCTGKLKTAYGFTWTHTGVTKLASKEDLHP